jgi:hypothetical protein
MIMEIKKEKTVEVMGGDATVSFEPDVASQ